MSRSSPPPSRKLSKYAPLILVMKVKPEKVNAIIGSGGKKVKSIIEETGVDAIDTQDNGIVKITAKDMSSLEKSRAIIANLTMVPTVGDIYKNCEIKSIAPYGVFVEIAPGREGLCHISELSSGWLSKAEDAFKVGDHLDVKLIEINEKGQLRLSHRALLPEAKDSAEQSSAKENIPPNDGSMPGNFLTIRAPLKKVTALKEVTSPSDKNQKFVRKLVSSAKDGPSIRKDQANQEQQ